MKIIKNLISQLSSQKKKMTFLFTLSSVTEVSLLKNFIHKMIDNLVVCENRFNLMQPSLGIK